MLSTVPYLPCTSKAFQSYFSLTAILKPLQLRFIIKPVSVMQCELSEIAFLNVSVKLNLTTNSLKCSLPFACMISYSLGFSPLPFLSHCLFQFIQSTLPLNFGIIQGSCPKLPSLFHLFIFPISLCKHVLIVQGKFKFHVSFDLILPTFSDFIKSFRYN